MLKNFFSFLKKYWIIAIALVVVIPFSVIAAEYIGGISYNQVGEVLDVSGAKGNNITLSYFGRSITLDISKYVGGPHYKEGYTLFIPNRTEAEFVSFLSSKAAIFLTGSCSSDCTGKTCGQLNGCGNVCVNQTCGTGYTCSATGVCTRNSDCGTKNCGIDSFGNICGSGTCGAGDYCNNGYCETCSCDGSDCGVDQCGNACGECPSPRKCLQIWNQGIFYQCVFCVPKCTAGLCGSDGCGGYCGCEPGKACDGKTCITCEPKCDGKKCGDDGCGGSCGECRPGEACINNDCEQCTPKKCDGSFCGDDGCGGVCSCGGGKICGADSKCYECIKNCEGKSGCSSDGCGGTCGGETCKIDTQVCNEFNGGCEECTCEGKQCGDDGCGNPCGSCANEEVCQSPWGDEYLNYKCVFCPDEGLKCGYSECGRYYGPCKEGETCIGGDCIAL